jgi:hypothetical protein
MPIPVPIDPGSGTAATTTQAHSWYTALVFLLAPPACRLTTTAAGSTGASAVFAAVPFNQETYDVSGMHDNVTNNTRITIATAGTYRIKGKLRTGTNTSIGAKFAISGTAQAETEKWSGFATGAFADVDIDTTIFLTAGQYVELQAATITATVALSSANCYLEALWVRS